MSSIRKRETCECGATYEGEYRFDTHYYSSSLDTINSDMEAWRKRHANACIHMEDVVRKEAAKASA